MDSKAQQMQEMMKLQETIALARKASQGKTIEIEEIKEDKEEVINTLPTEYISANQLKLSSKELTHSTSYLDRLRQDDDRLNEIKISEEKAIKIRRGLLKLTTGNASVVPLKCNGDTCAFKQTCLTGDTLVLSRGGIFRRLDTLTARNKVYSFNLETNLLELDKVIEFKRQGTANVYLITTKLGNSIKATANHPFLSTSNGKAIWVSIDSSVGNILEVGTEVLVSDFELDTKDVYSLGDSFIDTVISIELLGEEEVFDIEVATNQNFVANNFIVHNCPYWLEKVAPVGLACPVETQLIEYWLEKYQQEFNVEDNSITDMHMIARLCEYDIYDMRVTRYLAENDQTLLTDFISSYTEDGEPISNKATSAAFEVKERIDRLRSKTLKELMATREAKAKIAATVVNSASNSVSIAEMKKKYDELIKERATMRTVN